MASRPGKVIIRKLPTGVRGLDDILNIIAGTPGSGKTTLAHQILFANAPEKKPALYFTVLGEPAMKMLRYQQQYSFFDEAKVGKAIRLINLAEVVMEQLIREENDFPRTPSGKVQKFVLRQRLREAAAR